MKALFDLIKIKGFISPIRKEADKTIRNGEYEVLRSFWNLKNKGLEGIVFNLGEKIRIENSKSENGYLFTKGAIKEGYLKAIR